MEPKKLYLHEFIVCLKYFAIGVFSADDQEPTKETHRIIFHVVTWVIVESAYIAGCFDAGNFNDALLTFSITCSVMLSMVKYIAFNRNRAKLQNIIRLIEVDGIEYCKTDEFVLKSVQDSRRIFFTYFFMTTMCAVTTAISTTLAGGGKTNVDEVKMWEPIHITLPCDVVVYERFGVFTITTVFVSFYHGYTQAFLDVFTATLFTHVGRQFEAVADTFSRLQLSSSGDDSTDDFNKAVEYHKAVLKCAADMQAMLNSCFMGQIIESSLPLCFSLYLIVQNLNTGEGTIADIMTYIALLQYFIYQLYVMTRSADICTNRASSVADGVYKNEWHLASPTMRRQMAWVIQRAQQPMVFTACGVFPISIFTFIQIMKSAYTAFTLLKNVD